CDPENEDAVGWAALGVSRHRIRVTSIIQYDPGVQKERHAVAASLWDASSVGALNRSVLFGGSTHRGEEEILATVFLRLRQQFRSLRLFIEPRHFERLCDIRAQMVALI